MPPLLLLHALLLFAASIPGGTKGAGRGAGLGAQLVCGGAAGLTARQRALCRQAPAAMAAIGTGLRMAWSECRALMSASRWNCSGARPDAAPAPPPGSREAALTAALEAAGVAHAVAAGCARGSLPGCGCGGRARRPNDHFKWGGCSADVGYGVRTARRFLDGRAPLHDAVAASLLHNRRLGRKTVQSMVRRECKCHGVSGSCALRTCWRALHPFHGVGTALASKYARAKLVRWSGRQRRLAVEQSARPPKRGHMVYTEPSPTYCEGGAGWPGTHGRHCGLTTGDKLGPCSTLCCGRGHSSTAAVLETRCRCRFTWCCAVTCDTCTTATTEHTCN